MQSLQRILASALTASIVGMILATSGMALASSGTTASASATTTASFISEVTVVANATTVSVSGSALRIAAPPAGGGTYQVAVLGRGGVAKVIASRTVLPGGVATVTGDYPSGNVVIVTEE